MSTLWFDLRFTLRLLGRSPGFAALSVVVIALAGVLFVNGASYLQPEHRYWQNQAKWVGMTQSNISIPARIACSRSAGVPTPMR